MERKDFLKLLALLPFAGNAMNLQQFKNTTDDLENSDKMPVWFVGHGSPMNAIEDNPFTQTLAKMGNSLKEAPKAILVISAHWLTRGTYVHSSVNQATIHDFGGFPQALFDAQYPAKGSPEFAKEVVNLSPEIIKTANDWGLDHGAWAILMKLFPKAEIPVFQLSIDWGKPMDYHFNLAAQLKALRKKGVLIIGSGNIVHNLGRLQQNIKGFDWAIEFDEWAKKKLDERDFKGLQNYLQHKAGKLAAPSDDHYIPLIYTTGLTDSKDDLKTWYEEMVMGSISMRTVEFK